MATRREFFHSIAGAAAVTVPTLRRGGLERVFSATSAVAHRSPEAVAQDEDYWMQIQQAFTVDRSLINLNNGGVSPSKHKSEQPNRLTHLKLPRQGSNLNSLI